VYWTYKGNEDGDESGSIDGLIPEPQDKTTSNDLIGTDDKVLRVSRFYEQVTRALTLQR
jgi:hypothetical protein